eukprot:1414540-Amphidinium_carterae.1
MEALAVSALGDGASRLHSFVGPLLSGHVHQLGKCSLIWPHAQCVLAAPWTQSKFCDSAVTPTSPTALHLAKSKRSLIKPGGKFLASCPRP